MADDPTPRASSSTPGNPLGHAMIPMVNKLQDIFAQLGSSSTIDLPQVAVVGSQSSGKSSVLEALVGRDFLPRGSDICTRRPLVLQLVHSTRRGGAGGGEDESEWGEFLHLPGKRFFDFADIRREIHAETEREAGVNKGVSDKQIRLKVFSPNVLNITLVDLPGITKVPVGDQPSDIEARIRTMILSYIKHDTCIILAVTPANSDLANSDALQMARIADPDGSRTIGVITKLDIMDRGTDARNFLLGNVIPLRLGYVGVVNRSQEAIMQKHSIKEALAYEEDFFRKNAVYHGLSDRCGIPQLAKKLNQILVQHIKTVLPGLKARINAQLVAVAKEHAAYGDITESKAGQGALLLNILSKYSEAFSSLVEGKNEEMSTTELSGGARIHYIFQSIFVKSLEVCMLLYGLPSYDTEILIYAQQCSQTSKSCLVLNSQSAPGQLIRVDLELARPESGRVPVEEMAWSNVIWDLMQEVDPCDDLTDDDIHTAIQNATGPKSALFVPEVPFEVLVRRQIARLLDPSLQCARFIYDELIKMSHRCLANEMQRFPFLRKRMDEVIGNFLREGLEPSETMIGHIIEMEMDYINTSHPNFIGGSKAVEIALQQVKSSKIHVSLPKTKDAAETDKLQSSERKSRAILARPNANGAAADQGVPSVADNDRPAPSGNSVGSSWGISSFFGRDGRENRTAARDTSVNKSYGEHAHAMDPALSIIQLKEPPSILRPSETHTEQEAVEITVTKLLLKSYYDVVRKNIEDSVPKAIMHFLVNHTKRELHNVFIRKLYSRENLFEEMLQEPEEVAIKRKQTRETLRVLQQAFRTLDELPLEAETVAKGYSLVSDPTGLPRIHGLPTSSFYATSPDYSSSHTASTKNPKPRKSSHSGEQASLDVNGHHLGLGTYPTVEL
ncbi:dynamin-related protein 3A-like protein [Cinnamomum micranthum f. kanehirae]|uniref:Dynamin-related protein 3A-like protein n=1 Tax=Cinnamomum micranthum f. kanehirae TaxID=337451 RepID=A0A3S3N0N4_9MAGN|nr:dynamin-related protein 3A-like protein [Cinnamomum micranthum f. kanehirae]